MEVDARGSGGDPVTGATTDRSRVRLNIILWVAVLLCAASVIWLTTQMNTQHKDDNGDRSGGTFSRVFAVVSDKRAPGGASEIAGVKVNPLDQADREVQDRNGEILAAASRMATAFVNLDYKDADAAVEAVKAQATGNFKDQYEKSAKGLIKIAKRAESVMKGEVLWSGLVAGDEDSATVIAATTGTVANKTTDFKPQARNYRLQLELVLQDDRWLIRDLQFVA